MQTSRERRGPVPAGHRARAAASDLDTTGGGGRDLTGHAPLVADVLALQRLAGNAAVCRLVAEVNAQRKKAHAPPARGTWSAEPAYALTAAGTIAKTGHEGVVDNGIITRPVPVEMDGRMVTLHPGVYVEVLALRGAQCQVKLWSGFRGTGATIPADAFAHEPQIDDLRDKEYEIKNAHEVDNAVTFEALKGVLWDPIAGPQLPDVAQGDLGDCVLVAAFASQVLVDPAVIRDLFTEHDPGRSDYGVRLWVPEKPKERVSPFIRRIFRVSTNHVVKHSSMGDASYAEAKKTKTGELILWAMLLEKALAEMLGGYTNLVGGSDETIGAVFRAITGEAFQTQELERSAGAPFPPDAKKVAGFRENWRYLDDDGLLGALEAVVDEGRIALLGSKQKVGSGGQEDDKLTNVMGDHAYVLQAVRDGSVFLRNPWGVETPAPLSPPELRRMFSRIIIGGRARHPRKER
jgi:hypothetical protein